MYLYFAQCCNAVVTKVTLVLTPRPKELDIKKTNNPNATKMALFRETTLNNEFALIPKVTVSLVFVSMNKSQTHTQLPKSLVK